MVKRGITLLSGTPFIPGLVILEIRNLIADLTANWGTVKSAFQEPGPDPQSIEANEPKKPRNIFQTEKF